MRLTVNHDCGRHAIGRATMWNPWLKLYGTHFRGTPLATQHRVSSGSPRVIPKLIHPNMPTHFPTKVPCTTTTQPASHKHVDDVNLIIKYSSIHPFVPSIYSSLMPQSHQTFCLVRAMELVGIMLRSRCWHTTSHTITNPRCR